MKCSLCSSTCRTRTSVLVLPTSRGLGVTEERKLVCPSCAARGTLVVPELAQVAQRCACGEPARFCATCTIDRKRKPDRMQRSLARKLRALAKLAERGLLGLDHGELDELAEYNRGRAFGLEQAAGLVEGYRTEEEAPE